VTVRQLLTHTSGLPPWRTLFQVIGPMPPEPPAADPVTVAERWAAAEAALRTYPFVDRPGAAIRYSDLGFILLGMLAARLVGRPLDRLLADEIAAPLGLTGVTFRPMDAGVPRTSIAPTSHDALWRGRRSWGEVEDENAIGLGGVAGHAGLFARATDIAAFGQAWLDADPRLGIDGPTRAAAIAEQAVDATDRRGLGWQLAPALGAADPVGAGPYAGMGPSAFGHTGFTGTSLSIDPDRRLVVACLTNRVWAGRANDALRTFLPRLLRSLAAAFPVEPGGGAA
jgi:CubicO group peptidase (beta-lactamase class C family)